MAKLLTTLLLLATLYAARAADPKADATAKFLAGLSIEGTPLAGQGLEPIWKEHASDMEKAWKAFSDHQLTKIAPWASQYLGAAYSDRRPLFYFFSGPDFLYAHAFFPNASEYILCGIEPVGAVPDLEKIPRPALHSALANLRQSLNSSLEWSFFITKKMKVDFAQKQLTGTLPVLYFALARSGCAIESVELVWLDKTGAFVPEAGKGTTPGAKLVFSSEGREPQTLYYFDSNLADDGIKSNPGFMNFCEQQGRGTSLLKAASYLLHESYFAKPRSFLLAHSSLILQDDSGIPFKFFPDDQWRVRYCGRYVGPIARFKKYAQPELTKHFAVSTPVPVDFGFGYQWHPKSSSILIAEPKDTPAPAASQ